jgi:predicted RecB family nuclease
MDPKKQFLRLKKLKYLFQSLVRTNPKEIWTGQYNTGNSKGKLFRQRIKTSARSVYLSKCKGEIIQSDGLTTLPLVGASRAEAFAKNGIRSVEDVSKIDPFDKRFRRYRCFSPNVLALIKNYAEAVVQNKIIVKRKADLLKNEKICFVDLEYDPSGTSAGPYGIVLIGVLDENGKVTQHFLDNPKDERKMLKQFTKWYLKEKPVFVSYSSTSADRPQLLNSLARLKIPTFGIEDAFFDLYYSCISTQRIELQNVFLPMRGSMGLKDVSKALGYQEPPDLRISDGLQGLLVYEEFLRTRNENLKDLLRYNLSDLERTKFVFDKIRASLEQAVDSPNFEMESQLNTQEFSIKSNDIDDFICPKCRLFHSYTYVKKCFHEDVTDVDIFSIKNRFSSYFF